MFARDRSLIADGAIVLVCAWLFASPWILDYSGDAGWNSTIAAAVIAALAAARALGSSRFAQLRQADWLSVLIGLWLIAAPWILGGFEENAEKVNSVIVGLVVAVLALAVESAIPVLHRRQTTESGTT